ncbi:MAG: XdhC family protein [Firmicutes bacterium]|nr:XdhC family protein [Bacillota bacterium]
MRRSEFKRILEAAAEGRTEYLEIEGPEEKRYLRKFQPARRLIVLGGGHISQPVCHIGTLLGFQVTVVDDRPAFANWQRFPDVANVVCEEFRPAIRKLKINPSDYVCVVTRGHQWDGDCLREILTGTFPSYLGMIGSRRRVKGLYEVLEGEGFDRGLLERIHSPIGLAIGAVTPEEIAVSICAQLVEHRRKTENPEHGPVLDQTDVDPDLLEHLAQEHAPRAMMLVLETRGSTPAAAGALMAIDPLGRSRGTIGGGCSEAEVISLARQIARDGGSETVHIDMTNEAAAQEGMACGGTMEVLIEAVTDGTEQN